MHGCNAVLTAARGIVSFRPLWSHLLRTEKPPATMGDKLL